MSFSSGVFPTFTLRVLKWLFDSPVNATVLQGRPHLGVLPTAPGSVRVQVLNKHRQVKACSPGGAGSGSSVAGGSCSWL